MTTGREDGHLRYLITAYLFDNLSAEGRAEVEAHLAECAACRAELAELRATRSLVEEALALPGGEGAAGSESPATPYSFEAHRLERVLAAGRRGALFGRRTAWLSAAAMIVVALVAALVLPRLVSERTRGARGVASRASSPPPAGDAAMTSTWTEVAQEFQGAAGSELADAGGGAGAAAYGIRREIVPPTASAPPPTSPMLSPIAEGRAAPTSTIVVENATVSRDALPESIPNLAADAQPPAHGGRFDQAPKGKDASEPITFYAGKDASEEEAPLDERLAVIVERKSPGAGGKLDADDGLFARDRAAAPAPKPAAPAEELAKKAVREKAEELDKSIRAGESAVELAEDRSEIELKRLLENSRNEAYGSSTDAVAERRKSKEAILSDAAADDSKDLDSLEVLDLAGETRDRDFAEASVRNETRSAGRVPRTQASTAIAAPAPREADARALLAARRIEPLGEGIVRDELGSPGDDESPAFGYVYDFPGEPRSGEDPLAASPGDGEVPSNPTDTPQQVPQARSRQIASTTTGSSSGTFLHYDDPGEPIQGFQGEVAGGRIPTLNLLRALEEQTGLVVNYPSSASEPAFDPEPTIEVLGDDVVLDPPMIAAILETNGYELRRERLADGNDVLTVLPRGGREAPGEDVATLALQMNPPVQTALLAAAGEQATLLDLLVAPVPLDPATQKAGAVVRAQRANLGQVLRAVELAESGAVAQDPAALAGWFSGVLAGTIAPHPGSDLAVRAESRAEEEELLRAFDHYRRNDPSLDHRTFAARRLAVPAPVIGDEGLGQEGFRARYGVNPFVETERDRFSTFAMDVDTASYTRARTMIAEGRLPDPAAVRTEEFVNAFSDPRAADPSRAFSVFCEGGPSPFGIGGTRGKGDDTPLVEQVQITVKARDLAPGERRPAILTFAIDTSGSMQHGARLDLVSSALGVLLDGLAPDDRVGIVAYGTQAYLVLPHTPARERERIAGALESLSCHGATNVEAGLDLAYRLADEVAHPRAASRVIVCSDGVATSGERDAEALLRKVRVYADRGIYLSVVGFGEERYDDAFLERIANQGNGQYGYVSSARDAARLFADNLPAALSVLARDAKIQVDFDPAVVRQYRLLGYENRDVKDEDFRNDAIDAGEVGPGSTVTAIYEVVRRPASAGDLGRVHLRYHDTSLGRVEEIDFPIPPGVVATRLEGTSERFRLLASVAELAELLRGSYFARDGALSAVLGTLATLSPATVARPEVREFIDMTLRAREITLARWATEPGAR